MSRFPANIAGPVLTTLAQVQRSIDPALFNQVLQGLTQLLQSNEGVLVQRFMVIMTALLETGVADSRVIQTLLNLLKQDGAGNTLDLHALSSNNPQKLNALLNALKNEFPSIDIKALAATLSDAAQVGQLVAASAAASDDLRKRLAGSNAYQMRGTLVRKDKLSKLYLLLLGMDLSDVADITQVVAEDTSGGLMDWKRSMELRRRQG